MKKYNLSEIMHKAWKLYRKGVGSFADLSVYALRAAFGGCAPTRACGRSPKGEGEAKQKKSSLLRDCSFSVHFRQCRRGEISR